MNYRSRQVRLMWERDIKAKKSAWLAKEQTYKQDLLNLQNSTDAQILENLEKDLQKKQTLLNDTIALLGQEDINTLNDLQTLLEGKTLKELKKAHLEQIQTRNSEINSLSQKLDHLKEKTQFYLENLKTKEGIIEDYKKEVAEKDNNLTSLQKAQEKLTKSKDQLEEKLNHNLPLKEAKISELETSLFNLAKTKLANQKQAKTLIEQLEKEWKEKQANWEQTSQQQQEYAAQTLAQSKAEHQEKLKLLNQNLTKKQTKITELQEWTQGQHQRITELENQTSILELKLETNQRELQEQKTFYQQQIEAQDNQLQANERTITQLNQQITAHQANINQLTQQNQRNQETIRTNAQRITELEQRLQQSQRDSQQKQTTINNLNQNKINLQHQITQLAQNTQPQTQTESRRVLEQLLANREAELNHQPKELKIEDFQAWLAADESRYRLNNLTKSLWTSNLPNIQADNCFNYLIERKDFNQRHQFATNLGWKSYQKTVLKWKEEVEEFRKSQIEQEITLIKEILSHE